MNRPLNYFPLAAVLFWTISAVAQPSPSAPAGPQKLSASAIQILPVETADVSIPAEFRFAIYEHVIEQLNKAGTFQKVIRSGDHSADSIPDLVTLHIQIDKFDEGSQMQRELIKVHGATKIDVSTTVTVKDGHAVLEKKISGKV